MMGDTETPLSNRFFLGGGGAQTGQMQMQEHSCIHTGAWLKAVVMQGRKFMELQNACLQRLHTDLQATNAGLRYGIHNTQCMPTQPACAACICVFCSIDPNEFHSTPPRTWCANSEEVHHAATPTLPG